MADNATLGYLCFLRQDGVSLFTLVHQNFILLFLIYVRTEEYFDTSPTVYKSIISPSLLKFSLIKQV